MISDQLGTALWMLQDQQAGGHLHQTSRCAEMGPFKSDSDSLLHNQHLGHCSEKAK